MSRCSRRAPKTPLPQGLPLEVAESHPTFRYMLDESAQCELEAGHGEGTAPHDMARRHRAGEGLVWWDPPIVVIGGEPHAVEDGADDSLF